MAEKLRTDNPEVMALRIASKIAIGRSVTGDNDNQIEVEARRVAAAYKIIMDAVRETRHARKDA